MESKLLISFPDQSESFTNGYEAGQIDTMMSIMKTQICKPVHAENRELYEAMAEAYKYRVEFTETEYPEWLQMNAMPKAMNPIVAVHDGGKI